MAAKRKKSGRGSGGKDTLERYLFPAKSKSKKTSSSPKSTAKKAKNPTAKKSTVKKAASAKPAKKAAHAKAVKKPPGVKPAVKKTAAKSKSKAKTKRPTRAKAAAKKSTRANTAGAKTSKKKAARGKKGIQNAVKNIVNKLTKSSKKAAKKVSRASGKPAKKTAAKKRAGAKPAAKKTSRAAPAKKRTATKKPARAKAETKKPAAKAAKKAAVKKSISKKAAAKAAAGKTPKEMASRGKKVEKKAARSPKKAAAKKPAAKKAAAKKMTAKKPTAKKSTGKKPARVKSAAKKPAAKKAAAKKMTAKKPAVKKAAAKKSAAKKTARAKRPAAKKTARVKAPVKARVKTPVKAAVKAAVSAVRVREKNSLDNYKMAGMIGEGGMGKIYKAVDIRTNKTVVIKQLIISEREIFIKRFRREADIMLALNHNNIVTVYDYLKQGRSYYIIMEFVDGISLEDLIRKKGKIEPLWTLLIFNELCKGLKYAHDRQIIHRDIKPNNVLISKAGMVKLVDFGIAKSLEEDEELTKTGVVMGTPAYMSPEQILSTKYVDNLTDIYSMGVMFYQMLTGQRPYGAEFTAENLRKITLGDYVNPKQLNPALPSYCLHIIKKTMNHKKEKRVQDLQELINYMSGYLKQFQSRQQIHKEIKKALANL